MEIDRINPVIIGVLRATPADTPLLIRKSDRKPDSRTPMNAARNGSEARKPDWRNQGLYILQGMSETTSEKP